MRLPLKIQGKLPWLKSGEDEYRTDSPFPGFTLRVFRERHTSDYWLKTLKLTHQKGRWLYAINGGRMNTAYDTPEAAVEACELHAISHLRKAIRLFGPDNLKPIRDR